MTDWQVILLAVIALALVGIAGAQIVVAMATLRAARQVTEAVQAMQRDVRPLIDNASRITDDAARVMALAVTQAERVDRVLADTSKRIDETLGIVQGAVVGPIRQGAAILAAVRAAVGAVRGWQGRSRAHRDEDDALFVG